MTCKEAGAFNYPCNLCKKGKYYKKQKPLKKIDRALVKKAEKKATGADIHAVRGQLCLYTDNFSLLKSKDVKIRARALRRINKAEQVLNLYIKGKTIQEAIKEVNTLLALHSLH